MTREKEIAQKIYAIVGPKDNIETVTHCMTRLRLHLVKDADLAELKAIPGVLGVNQNGDELQIVLGPGKVIRVLMPLRPFLTEMKHPRRMTPRRCPKSQPAFLASKGRWGTAKPSMKPFGKKTPRRQKPFCAKWRPSSCPLFRALWAAVF